MMERLQEPSATCASAKTKQAVSSANADQTVREPNVSALLEDSPDPGRRCQQKTVGMLRNFNEHDRPRHQHTSAQVRSDGHVSSENKSHAVVKRKAPSSPPISPPPLKRQATSRHEQLHSVASISSRKSALLDTRDRTFASKPPTIFGREAESVRTACSLEPYPARHVQVDSSGTGHFVVPSTGPSKGRERLEYERAFISPTIPQRSRQDDEVSLSSSVARSDLASSVMKCNKCKKSSSRKYDRLFKCLTCRRYFHDGCRRPSLTGDSGTECASWRCYRCISKGRTFLASPNEQAHGDNHPAATGRKINPETSGEGYRAKRKSATPPLSVALSSKGVTQVPPLITQPVRKPKSEIPSIPDGTTSHSIQDPKDATLYAEAASFGLVDNTELEKPTLGSTTPKNTARSSQPGSSSIFRTPTDRLEIPNTPSQRSSHPLVESICAGSMHVDQSCFSLSGQSPSLVDEPKGNNRPKSLVPCCECKEPRILAEIGDETPICSNCKKQGRTSDLNNSTIYIPETPGSVSASGGPDKNAADISGLELVAAVLNEAERMNPFHERVARDVFRREIVAKKISRTGVPIPLEDTTMQDASPAKDQAHPSSALTEDVGQPRQDSPSREKQAIAHAVANVGFEPMGDGLAESEGDAMTPIDDVFDEPMADDTSEVTTLTEVDSRKPSRSCSETENGKLIVAFAGKDGSYHSCTVVHRDSVAPLTGGLAADGHDRKHYTIRELIGIAFLVAKEPALTMGEVQDWIATIFPETHRKGKGTWERNISPVLSQYNDFRKTILPGKVFKWSFVDQATRMSYEQRFPEYCLQPAVGGDMQTAPVLPLEARPPLPKFLKQKHTERGKVVVASPNTQRRSRLIIMENTMPDDERNTPPTHTSIGTLDEAIAALMALKPDGPLSREAKTKDVQLDKVMRFIQQNCRMETQSEVSTPTEKITILSQARASDSIVEDVDSVFMPFEPVPQSTFEFPPDIRIEKDFFQAFPGYTSPSIERMSQTEKDFKIKEIKQRPSRKATFGSLLSSARHFRDNVHNELEQVRKPNQIPPEQPRATEGHDGDVEMGDNVRAPQTLKELLELPGNALPMLHEGQLAFRDGTLVNGKLPRSRVVYRVGKKTAGF